MRLLCPQRLWSRNHQAGPWVSVFWTAAASEARRRSGLDGRQEGNLIQSFGSETEPKRRRRSALPAQSKESLDCASKTSNLQIPAFAGMTES